MKKFRKPYFAVLLSALVLSISCEKYDDDEIYNSKSSTPNYSNLITTIQDEVKTDSNNDDFFIIFNNWVESEDLENISSIQNIDFSNSELLFNYADLHYSKEADTLFENFNNNVLASGDILSSLALLELNSNNSNLSDIEKQSVDIFAKTIKIMLDNDLIYDEFNNGDSINKRDCNWWICAGATISYVRAFAALVAIEVGSVGAATLFVVFAYIIATIMWGYACDPCF